MASLGELVVKLSADIASFQSDLGKAVHIAERQAGRMTAAFQAIPQLLAAGGVAGGLMAITSSAIEAERSINRMNAVLRSTGHAAGLTRKDLEGLASELRGSTVFDDDQIREGINSLLRFQDVQGDTFKQATRLAVDLASAMGTSLPDAFQKVGRALSDPERGLRALRDAGVFLNQTQAETAKQLFATGEAAKAQKIILDELAKTVGGAAAGDAQGLHGALKAQSRAWEDFKKALGSSENFISRSTRLFQMLTQAIEFISPAMKEAADTAADRAAAIAGAAQRAWEQTMEAQTRSINEFIKKTLEARKKAEDAFTDLLAKAEQKRNDVREQAQREGEERADRERQAFLEHRSRVELAALKRQEDAEAAADAALKKTTKSAQDFGFTFNSALEDAIINGGKLIDVVNALGRDIARMIIRKTITEPLGNIIGAGVQDFFKSSGGDANAGMFVGAFASGTDYVPRTGLALVHQGEQIIPAGEGRSTNINFTVNSLDPATAAQVIVANRRVITSVVEGAFSRAGRASGMKHG